MNVKSKGFIECGNVNTKGRSISQPPLDVSHSPPLHTPHFPDSFFVLFLIFNNNLFFKLDCYRKVSFCNFMTVVVGYKVNRRTFTVI